MIFVGCLYIFVHGKKQSKREYSDCSEWKKMYTCGGGVVEGWKEKFFFSDLIWISLLMV